MNKRKTLAVLLCLLALAGNIYAGRPSGFKDKYQLKEVVVLSRHNIRSPLSGNGSALAKMTPHLWFNWTSGPSELSLRGGVLETMMGQYFRKWLVSENLIKENEAPSSKEMRFYANSMQRTVATARYFSTGMLPTANVKVEHRFKLNKMDPVFNPQLTLVNDKFKKLALEQISAMGGKEGLQGIGKQLTEEFNLIENVLDFEDSAIASKEGKKHLSTDDLEIILEKNKEPAMKGSLKLANQASDAFILQYYEEPDDIAAAFGHKLTQEEWGKIAGIKDVYGDVLFTAPAVAVNVANPLLKLLLKELSLKKRKFTFLCGHDSNIASVLAALNAVPYDLPQSIEKKTPIGSKLVFSKWLGKDGEEYISVDLIYQTVHQLRYLDVIDLDNPPAIFPVSLQGLNTNSDGLYKMQDIKERFKQAILSYRNLPK